MTPPPGMVVVDTDVVSFLFRRDTRADLYRPHLVGRVLAISFMTLAELDQWALQHHWGTDRQEQLAEQVSAINDLETTILRFFNVYGPGQSLKNPYVGVLGNFLAELQTSREGDHNLLDRTMVLYTSNLGNSSSHDNTNLPILLARRR